MPTHASQLLSRNIASLLGLLVARRRARARLGRRDRRRRVRDADGGGGVSHTDTVVTELTVLVLAIFLGFEVISKVPTMLHTPLMSGTNAIHGIVIVGAMIVAGSPHQDALIRDHRLRRGRAGVGERRRRLRRHRPHARDVQEARAAEGARTLSATGVEPALPGHDRRASSWRCGSSRSPATARRGNQIGAVGMLLAIVVTLARRRACT